MRHAAGKLADCFHLAALQQRFLGAFALLDLLAQVIVGFRQGVGFRLQFQIGAAQFALRGAGDEENQRGHHDQQRDRRIPCKPHKRRFPLDAQIDQAVALAIALHRHGHFGELAVEMRRGERRRDRRRDSRRSVERSEHFAVSVINVSLLDLWIGHQRLGVVARGCGVGEH